MGEFAFLLWIGSIVICMIIGQKKGEIVSSFIGSFILGPFWIPFALISKGKKLKCPHCAEMINKEANICPHCRMATEFYHDKFK